MRAKVARRRGGGAARRAEVVEQLLASPAVVNASPAVRNWLTALLREGQRCSSAAAAGRQEGGAS
jgi:hypothetical protein